ncbi:type IV pili methyl-accepting chemotaxis transducer N-terminal domain-containing protein [Rhodoferax sp. TS-BS-61-7]|uniref:type IV pili methyl-accepting chemotaxis transducer N-terminal domain-containing protein n=1 Tax=Rhodoferax sp. TS-BS-61-7 TaxID=2094194 RepID=UPI000CF64F1F|nr:type IV pili methyl-accepting chemotaxis transducer N-terminal domain-containing protein [Rhodoferax sp. TS-BS-61-7]PQA76408.1 response regulator receiver protein [Rhodoferax sp. TS-BS-61-7]
MTSALLCSSRQKTAPTLAADLAAAGIAVLATVEDCSKLVQALVLHAPDVVICDLPLPTAAWLQALQMVGQTVPRPLIVFTHDTDAAHIQQATDSGVHVYVVHGYGANRLRPLIHLAQARFQKERQQREAFEDMATRFEERKAVDRAKGILMRAQSLSDDDAFRTLRSAAMNSNQRMGQLSQHIIQSAHFAEAVNRSGQLRMLSQRLVKLHLLQAAGVQPVHHAALLKDSLQWVDSNFALLRKNLSQPTYGDLLEQVAQTWELLKAALAQGSTDVVEQQAEALLLGAERLTTNLESSGAAAPLHVLNLAGRQRMLSQRYSKYVLLSLVGEGAVVDLAQASMRAAQREFEDALTYLNGIPLSTPDIHGALGAAGVAWLQMVAAAQDAQRLAGSPRSARLQELATGSETLLGLFEQLSTHYERSMQMLLGEPEDKG